MTTIEPQKAGQAAAVDAKPKKSASSQTGQVQSLVKALRLMRLLADNPAGMSLKEVSATTAMPASTTHRLLSTLQQEGFVRFDRELMHWSIGVQAFSVGYAFLQDRDLVRVAKARMTALMETSGETANLSILDGANIVYLAQVASRQMMRAMSTPGQRVPLHCTAAGKAIIACLPNKTKEQILSRLHYMPMTPHTLTERASLQQHLAQVLVRGYALDDEEHALGLRCIASPVFDENGAAIAAISISGPLARMADGDLDAMGGCVLDAARAVTRDYGGLWPSQIGPTA